jgi:hypothetical protein
VAASSKLLETSDNGKGKHRRSMRFVQTSSPWY